jgi:hypothetical protein
MTESEWWACQKPQKMLEFLRDSGKLSERKLRLLAVAATRCLPQAMSNEGTRLAVESAERFVEGLPVSPKPGNWRYLLADLTESPSVEKTNRFLDALTGWPEDLAPLPGQVQSRRHQQAQIIRCLFGPVPFRPVAIPADVLAWNDGRIVKLAAGIYEEREFSTERMGVLADAMEEAGFADQELLGHLRGPGPHCRGCFAIDLLLGRS